MALLTNTKLRSLTTIHRHRLFSTSILSPDSTSPLNSIQKSRAALSLLRFEENPERILEICRAAALTPESHLDRVAYANAIQKLKKSNYYDGIRGFINDSLARPDLKSERSISYLIVLYGQAGLVKDAIKLFDEMPNMGFASTVTAMNSLLNSCILAGEYGEMKRIFSEFPKNYGLEPNVDTYNTVLKGFCGSGSANSTYSILAEMDTKGIKPNTTTFSTVIAGFYKEEKFNDVDKMLDLMKRYGVHPGIGIHNVRIQSLCKLKRSNEAKALLHSVMCRGMKPNCVSYSNLIYGFCKEGNLDMAKRLFKEMTAKKLKVEAQCYFMLVYYLCKGGDFEAALVVCKESMEKGWVPNIATMKCLVDGLVNIGKVDEAKGVVGVMKEKFSRHGDKWVEIEEGLPE